MKKSLAAHFKYWFYIWLGTIAVDNRKDYPVIGKFIIIKEEL